MAKEITFVSQSLSKALWSAVGGSSHSSLHKRPLTEVCKIAEGESVTIYTYSQYAFGVVHDFDAIWKQFVLEIGQFLMPI